MGEALPGGRGESSDIIDSILQKDIAGFGEMIDKYGKKDEFMKKLAQGQEGSPLNDWIEAVFVTHKSEDMNLSWSDVEDEEKSEIAKIFEAESEVWAWMLKNK